MITHDNSGDCQKCEKIFNKYPGFNNDLKNWFKFLQCNYPEAHIMCAGRNEKEQEYLYKYKSSMNRYGQSAHNYNAAIDIFRMHNGKFNIDKEWFNDVVLKNINDKINWHGLKGDEKYNIQHIELKNWRELKTQRILKLVGN